jgi:hypothetical protein
MTGGLKKNESNADYDDASTLKRMVSTSNFSWRKYTFDMNVFTIHDWILFV